MSSQSSLASEASKDVLILLHGIRTNGPWHELVRRETQESHVVHALGYRYFNAFMFWCPGFTRDRPYRKTVREIRQILEQHKDSRISVIAHSFGTYLICRILNDNPDIHFHRVIFCGAVVDQDFAWDKISHQITGGAVNDCGTLDVWPVLAQASTWGYGASGVFGFKSALIRDRFHPIGHDGCFKTDFICRYWLPFLKSGERVERPSDAVAPAWMPIVALLPLRWGIVILTLLCIFLVGQAGVANWRERQPIRLLASIDMRGYRDGSVLERPVAQNDLLYHGDQFRVRLETQTPCWVYVFGVDESSTVSGSAAVNINTGNVAIIPSAKEWFKLHETPGKQKVYVLASRRRIGELDQAIADKGRFDEAWFGREVSHLLYAPEDSTARRAGTMSFDVAASSTGYFESKNLSLTGLIWGFENRPPPE